MSRWFLALVALFVGALQLPVQAASAPTDDLNAYFKPVQWRSIGPFRGGRSVASTGVIGDPKTYYMGTTGGGLWKTDDMGLSWRNISDGYFKTGTVGAIAVAASDPNVVYVGMGEHAVRGVMTHTGDGVYRSTDAGQDLEDDRPRADPAHLADRRASRTIRTWCTSRPRARCTARRQQRGVFKSTDGGATWKKVLFVDDRTGAVGAVDGRDQPADPVRRDVGARPPALEGHQRRPGQRPVQVDRQRRDLGADEGGPARGDGQDGDRRQPARIRTRCTP